MPLKWWILIVLMLLITSSLAFHSFQKAKSEKINGMVSVPAGEFLMGLERAKSIYEIGIYQERKTSPEPYNFPKRKVYVRGFYIDKYEVTNGEYLEFIKETSHRTPAHWENGMYPLGGRDLPVVNVSFYDALDYALWVGKRLPTEEEWEKTAAGEDGRRFPWGDEFFAPMSNTWESGIKKPTPVDKYKEDKSSYGVSGMSGNVMEWTCSRSKTPNDNLMVVKGGSWASDAFDATAQSKVLAPPDVVTNALGFRCVYSPLSDVLIQKVRTLVKRLRLSNNPQETKKKYLK